MLEPTFTISTDSKELNSDQEKQEYRNPNAYVEVCTPEFDGDTGGSKFEGQDYEP